MKRVSSILLSGFVALFASLGAMADGVDAALQAKLKTRLESGNDGLSVREIREARLPGMFEVELINGPVVYTDKSGEFFIAGDMYQVTPTGYVNLAEQRRDGQRKAKLEAVKREDMIVFSPEGETKAHINVFTDVTCYYCQKLHQEVPELNRRGVEVRYLAYPRAGEGSDGFKDLVTAWCSENPQETLTKLKNKKSVPTKTCPDNPVAMQYLLGQDLGVRGTPAIITGEGTMLPGYQPAAQLVKLLGVE